MILSNFWLGACMYVSINCQSYSDARFTQRKLTLSLIFGREDADQAFHVASINNVDPPGCLLNELLIRDKIRAAMLLLAASFRR